MNADVLKSILTDIKNDQRYKHGTAFTIEGRNKSFRISDHITSLENNLEKLSEKFDITQDEYWALMFLIHTHDTMKMHAVPHAKIHDKFSHSTLAREFAAEYCTDDDLLSMLQFHEEPFAIYRKVIKKRQDFNIRLDVLLDAIKNWRLFLMFIIIDNCVPGCSRKPISWIIHQANKRSSTKISDDWLID